VSAAWHLIVSALVLAAAGVFCMNWLRQCGQPPRENGAVCQPERWELWIVFGCALGFRLVVALVSLCFTGWHSFPAVWQQWDAYHYVRLVESGYTGYVEDGQHLFLVFFPLYVWIVRLVRLVIPNTVAAGMLVSRLCYALGCVYLYRLAALEYGRAAARRTLLFLSLFPYAFFFGGVMTEGLFLLTTAAALYYIRTHRWLLAGLWGAMAALTRMQGLLLVGAALAELGIHYGWKNWKAALKRLPAVFLPLLGTLAYLGLNVYVDGDPFSFVRQQEHWFQGFQWISGVLSYLLRNAFHYERVDIQWHIWIPSVILFVVFAAFLWLERGKHRSTYLLYALAYLILTYSLSWLLSAGRYLSCAIPFFLFAGARTEGKPVVTGVLLTGMGLLFFYHLSVYLAGGQIM